jgi:glycosyltransferase involved in cell wall biosynthesis
MRILFITNYFPPSNYGWGYMQLCEEVADGLAVRGHEIAVLTSTHLDGPEPIRPYPVYRLLPIDPNWHSDKSAAWQFFIGRKRREVQAVDQLREVIEDFKPQVIFIWHAIGLPRPLLQAAEHEPESVLVYYFAGYLPELPDEYIAYWKSQPVGRLAKIFKRSLARLALWQLRHEGRPVKLEYRNVICVSEYVKQRLVSKGLIPQTAVVIHNGVDLSVFSPNEQVKSFLPESGLQCLIAGRVTAEKGIHTVIDAFAELSRQLGESPDISLTVLGSGPAGYTSLLRSKVQDYRLQNIVSFKSPVPRSEMPAKLAAYDVLILPSEYEEPIARSMQEAMAMGLLVIGTTTGGSGELLVHEQTGLVFEAGNAQSLTHQLKRALVDPDLVVRLAQAGRTRVEMEFNIDHTVGRIDAYLISLVEK